MTIEDAEYYCENCDEYFCGLDYCPDCGNELIDEGTGVRAIDDYEDINLVCTQCESESVFEIDSRPTYECNECGFQGSQCDFRQAGE